MNNIPMYYLKMNWMNYFTFKVLCLVSKKYKKIQILRTYRIPILRDVHQFKNKKKVL